MEYRQDAPPEKEGSRGGSPVDWPCDEDVGVMIPPEILLERTGEYPLSVPNDITFHQGLQSFLITDDSSNPPNRQAIFRMGLDGTQLARYNLIEGPLIQGVAAGYLPSKGQEVVWIARDNGIVKAFVSIAPPSQEAGREFAHDAAKVGSIAWHPARNALLVYDSKSGGTLEQLFEYTEHGVLVGAIDLPWYNGRGISVLDGNDIMITKYNNPPLLTTIRLVYDGSNALVGYEDRGTVNLASGDVRGMAVIDDCAVQAPFARNAVMVYRNYGDSELHVVQDGYCCPSIQDFEQFSACMQGPGVTYENGPCLNWDFDGDNDVDLRDFAEFQVQYSSR